MMHAKLYILELYWDTKVSELKKKKTKEVQKLAVKLMVLDKELLRSFLRHYLKRCQIRHQLAFFQWRSFFCKNAKSVEL